MRRRLRTSVPRPLPAWLFIVMLLAAVTLVAGLPYAIASKDARDPGYPKVEVRLDLPPGVALEGLQGARVQEVINGDTIDVLLGGTLTRIRYYGVDTPERGDRCFREAKERNQQLIGKRVLLLPDARDKDRFGRVLRYAFLADGASVDATLVAEGFGVAWREDGRYKDEIVKLEDEAQKQDRGCLWH